MHSPRHFAYFMALGLFWGMSPALYKHLANINMPPIHTVAITGLGVGLILWAMVSFRNGTAHIPWYVHRYGAACAFLMNIPFGINLYLARHVPPTELAVIITTSPFFNYLVALATGWEHMNTRKLAGIAFGFASTVVLILSRESTLEGKFSWWLLSAFSVPLLYCVYNAFAARAFPKGADTLQLGTAESIWSGLLCMPIVLLFAPFGGDGHPPLSGYWILFGVILMWVIERIAYFVLIREKGAVYTVQATYVATPMAVLIAIMFFGGGNDLWLFVSVALLMVALYLNNSSSIRPAATQPSA
jgi:drug/metabolite transporter (DMT)-like permease